MIDVTARGNHVDGIQLVAHVDALTDHKDYLRRSGHKVRASDAGGVVVLQQWNNKYQLRV